MIALPLAGVAFVVGMVLNPLSGQSSPFDQITYPFVSLGMFVMYLVLLIRNERINLVILMAVNLSSLFFLSKLIYILFAATNINIVAEMTESFFWIPAMYVVSLFADVQKRARIMPSLFVTGMLTISFEFIAQNLLGATANYSAIFALLELNLANMTLLTISHLLVAFKDGFVRAETHAETMQHLAYTYQLTGLNNRLGIQLSLEQTLGKSDRQPVSLIFLDLDDTVGEFLESRSKRIIGHDPQTKPNARHSRTHRHHRQKSLPQRQSPDALTRHARHGLHRC